MEWKKHETNPYSEKQLLHCKLRKFDTDTPQDQLEWHWDECDRVIVPMHHTDWGFQTEDDDDPDRIRGAITVKAGTFHRLIKGRGPLTVLIVDLDEDTLR